MIIKLRWAMTGSVDGMSWPPPGVAFEVADNVGAKLCKMGAADPSKAAPDVELAVVPETHVETREEKPAGLSKTTVTAEPKEVEKPVEEPMKRGPGRPRKHPRT